MSDPRLDVLRQLRPFDSMPRQTLAALDAAAQDAGIVRVDTRDGLCDAADLVTGILRADIAVGFREADPRVIAALDRMEQFIVALREGKNP